MTHNNLSEVLFKPSFKYAETSTLIQHTDQNSRAIHSSVQGSSDKWYRDINRTMWIWSGADPAELSEVLARIAVSSETRSDDRLLDTVIGYRRGNWIYEWVQQGMRWQQKSLESADDPKIAAQYAITAARFYSIAAYPYLRGDTLADQATVLCHRIYRKMATLLADEVKQIEFKVNRTTVQGFLLLPSDSGGPYPTVILCNSLESFQHDHHRFFRYYLAPAGIALLTVDSPSIGFSASCSLTQDTSYLHREILSILPTIPWIDPRKVALLGIGFGANSAVRLGYLATEKIRAVACIEPVVHSIFATNNIQQHLSPMSVDMWASHLGLRSCHQQRLQTELSCFSLKKQGLLGRKCTTPMLAATLMPEKSPSSVDARLIVNSSSAGKLLHISSNPVHNGIHTMLTEICSWLQSYLH